MRHARWYFRKLGTLRQLRNNPFKVWYLDDNSQRQSFEPTDPKLAHALFGQQNRHLRQIERLTGVRVSSKGTTAMLEGTGEGLARAVRLLEELTGLLVKGFALRPPDIEYADRILSQDTSASRSISRRRCASASSATTSEWHERIAATRSSCWSRSFALA